MAAEIIPFPQRTEGPLTERDACIQAAKLLFSQMFEKSMPHDLAEKLADATLSAPRRTDS